MMLNVTQQREANLFTGDGKGASLIILSVYPRLKNPHLYTLSFSCMIFNIFMFYHIQGNSGSYGDFKVLI